MPRRFAVAVLGQLEALHSTRSARAQGDMWVNQHRSRDPLAAATDRAVGSTSVLFLTSNGQPKNWRTLERRRAAGARQVHTRSAMTRTPSSGLAPPAPEEMGHSGVTESLGEQTRFCVRYREGDKGVKPLETAQHDRVVQRTSVRACLCLSSVAGTSRQCSEVEDRVVPPTPRTKRVNKLPANQPQGRVVQHRAALADKRLR